MTAGAGIVHSEMPSDDLVRRGGAFHAIQLWVNLPRARKWTPPRYQDVRANAVPRLESGDGGARLRLVAGGLGDQHGPARTHTPIVLAHATLHPDAWLRVPWPPGFNALVYVLAGRGSVGDEGWPIHVGQLAVFGDGTCLELRGPGGSAGRAATCELLLMGGAPIREPVVHYGPFVMNEPSEIYEAIEDYRSGRLGRSSAVEGAGAA
jgi:redox-sensitive bicupin YhaK (pirin superfamily)